MNCPTCGAQNDDAEARFCAECGTPLEDQEIEAAKAEQVFDDSNQDKTILSSPTDLAAEQAKTLTVDEAKLAAALDEGEEATPSDQPSSQPEPSPSEPEDVEPADPGSGSGGESGGADNGDQAGGNNRKMIIIGAVVLLLLFCCCCSVAIGGAIGSDPDAFEDILRDLTALPVSLLLV